MTWQKLFPFKSTFHALPNGHKIHVATAGNGSPVVMLHGNPTWSFMFRNLMERLSLNGFQALAVDQLGCGLSDKPQTFPYTLEAHVDNLDRLIAENLQLKQFDLVLHDWGGPVGLAYAIRHPERVRRIVAMNTVAWADSRIPKAIYLTKCPWLGALLVRHLNILMRMALRVPCHPLPPDVREGFCFPYGNYRNRIAIQRFPQDIPLSSKHPSASAFKRLEEGMVALRNHPFLICWGEQDKCFPLAFLDKWRQLLPLATIKQFPNASHFLLEDQPDEVGECIVNFLTA